MRCYVIEMTKPMHEGGRTTAPISLIEAEETLAETHEESPFYSVISFDPGGRTGWAVFAVYPEAMENPDYRILDNVVLWSAGEFFGPEDEQVDAMLGLAEAWPDADLVIEDFIPDPSKPLQDREVWSPVRITAAFAYAVRFTGSFYEQFGGERPVYRQPPALAAGSFPDERFRSMFPTFANALTGQKDARSAVKHALVWLKRKKSANQMAAIGLARAARRAE